MSRAPLALTLLLAALAGARAEDAPSNPAANSSANPDASKSHRVLSPEIAAKLATFTPKFTPPAPAPAEPRPPARVPTETAADSDADRPRNQIIRLPAYLVEDYRMSNYKDRQILTPKAKVALMFQKHPGLHIGNLFGWNSRIAAFMVWEEERLERMRELQDLASLMSYGSPEEFKSVKREVQKAFMREPDFGR